MKLKVAGILALVAVGVAAFVFTVFPPGSGSSASTRYVTATATKTDVINQVVATGTVEPVAIYGLAFGSKPTTLSSTSSSSSSSSSSSGNNGGSTTTWNVVSVDATPGQAVTAGQDLAHADASDAQLNLTVAKASLAAAEARLSLDKAGLTPTDRAAARLSVTQAQQAVSQAATARSQTAAQNNLRLSQASRAVSQARAQLKRDENAQPPVPATQIKQDKAAVTQAEDALASLRLQVAQSNTQASNQVRSSQNQLRSARLGYKSKTQGATAATLASDRAAVATAQKDVATAQDTVDAATLVSPVDGVVLAVNITPGVDAPSGNAITVQSNAFQVAASVAETDLPVLKLGQATDVTVTATKLDATGKVTQISPSGSAGTGGGVVSYAIVVAVPEPPAGTAAGMSAQVSITTASAPSVVAVPSIALVGGADGYSVRVLDGSGQPQNVPVEVGLVTTSLAEIKSGIDAGTAVVVGTSSSRQGTTTTNGGFGGAGIGGGTFVGGGRFGQP
jgi:multidrug efflux pump subunit AcrA (membrane-fusion protein)